jgi:hypothetical protein
MIQSIFSLLMAVILMFSCHSLHSTTTIQAKDEFILGNNKLGRFSANVTNISTSPLTIWQYPIDGGRHSPLTLQPAANVKLKVGKNTALRIENSSDKSGDVKLDVKGDVGLSMGYKN